MRRSALKTPRPTKKSTEASSAGVRRRRRSATEGASRLASLRTLREREREREKEREKERAR
jgi:hypothetical protein